MSIPHFRSNDHAAASQGANAALPAKVTLPYIQEKKRLGRPITALTAYDYATARLVDESGIDMILVGDSLAMVVMGLDSTLAVTVEEMLHHTRAVRRAVRRAVVVADMPFGAYASVSDGVANAVRFIKEGGAEAVKIEGGRARLELIERLADAEIPVIGHLGLTPQSVHRMGGYSVQGKTLQAIEELRRDAIALEHAGATAVVLEGVPREVAKQITAELSIPSIGIGAGPDTDGQILVIHDLVNMSFSRTPKFVRQFGDAAALYRAAIEGYRDEVEGRQFPSDAHSYHLGKEERRALEEAEAKERELIAGRLAVVR
jgi:3-methyl-2-oxobutanoate hydroxymethyltransferase